MYVNNYKVIYVCIFISIKQLIDVHERNFINCHLKKKDTNE